MSRSEEQPIVRARRSVATDACAQTLRAREGAQRRACALAVVQFPGSLGYSLCPGSALLCFALLMIA